MFRQNRCKVTKQEDFNNKLTKNVEILESKLSAADKITDGLVNKVETVNERILELSKDVAVVKQQIADQGKRIDEWDRRLWGLVSLTIGALLSLAAGLIVVLVKR